MSVVGTRIFGWRSPEEEEAQARAGLAMPAAQPVIPLGPGAVERRRVRRSRVLLRGKLVFDEGALSTDCIVRDLSVWGARVRLGTELLLRDTMYLIESQNCVAHEARRVWKNGYDLGLQFTGRRDLDIASAPQFRIMREIWVELRAR